MHEHLYCSPPPFATREAQDLDFGHAEGAALELSRLADAGGGAVCELTTPDYGRDVSIAVQASRASGVHVVQATGLQKGLYYPAGTSRRSEEDLASQFVHDLRVGVDGTEARAGLIKVGTCSTDEVWDVERTVFAAAAIAAGETGAPIMTHTQAGTLGDHQLDMFDAAGHPLEQVCIGHLDRHLDFGYLNGLAARGAWLGFDQWTKAKYAADEERAAMILSLIDAGHTRLMVSGDLGRARYQHAYGGGPGLDGCLNALATVLPDDVFTMVAIDNPAEFLVFGGRR